MTRTDSLIVSPSPALQSDTVELMFDIDSVSAHLPVVDSAEVRASAVDSVALAVLPGRDPEAWLSGMEGAARQTGIGSDSGILTILVLLFVSLALNVGGCRRMFTHFFDELGSFKDRNNAFDEHTPNESRLTFLLVVQFIVCSGILLYVFVTAGNTPPGMGVFTAITRTVVLMGGYYIFQLVAYNTVGYIFTTPERRAGWIAGFNATQSMLGLTLLLPVLLAVFYPSSDRIVIMIALALYFIARILFIVKGFRIFFVNFSSLLYFILYLCTLEIIPLLFVNKLARAIL